MASDAERAREWMGTWIGYEGEIPRNALAALLAQVRLEEARYIRQQTQSFHNSCVGRFFDVHIAKLERAAETGEM